MKSVKVLREIPTDLEPTPINWRVREWRDEIADAKNEDELSALIRAAPWTNIIRDDGYVHRLATPTIHALPPMTVVITITMHDGQPVQSAGVYRGTIKSGSWLIVEDELGEIRALKASYTTVFLPFGDDA